MVKGTFAMGKMFSGKKYHPYHLVTPSPWPLLISIAAFVVAIGATMYMHSYRYGFPILLLGILHVILIMGLWWRDVIREATFEGMHTQQVQDGLKLGFILFIISEIMFFVGFFWAFFHSSLSPAIQIGCIWPPYAITPFNPLGIPLINTLLLLLSGCTITYTHHALVTGNISKTVHGFAETLYYAFLFTGFQIDEYIHAPFAISDGIYGSVFFMTTGLHGFHVIIGGLFIAITFLRFTKAHFTTTHHLGFEMAAWYWHFVDIVWLIVYTFIYWWGGL
jgi:heme/copper-type cytochrome/quinol oxidase subunit 3